MLLHSCVSFGLENTIGFSKSSRTEIWCFGLFFVVDFVLAFFFFLKSKLPTEKHQAEGWAYLFFITKTQGMIKQFKLEGTVAAIWPKPLQGNQDQVAPWLDQGATSNQGFKYLHGWRLCSLYEQASSRVWPLLQWKIISWCLVGIAHVPACIHCLLSFHCASLSSLHPPIG